MANQPWNLESFLNSLIVELDRARETLAVKAINKKITYAVKELSLDLQLFPSFDGRQVKFLTAQPGQEGVSKLSIQLGSITDQLVRATSKEPISKDDVALEEIEDINEEAKHELRKIGVTTAGDLAEIENRNVDLEKVSNRKVDYRQLANLIRKVRRNTTPPSISKVSVSRSQGKPVITLEGEHLMVDRNFEPVAVFNRSLATVLSADSRKITIGIEPRQVKKTENELIMTVDPYTIFQLKVNDLPKK